jgi:organic radical activating enzyme
MYAHDETFYRVVSWLVKCGVRITFETNGTVSPDFDAFPAYRQCTFALSVKLSNSGEPKARRIRSEALKSIGSNAKDAFWKFALSFELVESTAKAEIDELRALLPALEVFCMPIGESRASIWHHDRAVFAFCMRYGFRYSDRLHIRVFDTTQGV